MPRTGLDGCGLVRQGWEVGVIAQLSKQNYPGQFHMLLHDSSNIMVFEKIF